MVKLDLLLAMVKAIREDSEVGEGTCSIFAEATTDAELIEESKGDNIKSLSAAVKYARWANKLYWDNLEENTPPRGW